MTLNAMLIAAVFIAAAFIGQRPLPWMKNLGLTDQWLRAALWLTAVIVSLPMFIATARKLQALGLSLGMSFEPGLLDGPKEDGAMALAR